MSLVCLCLCVFVVCVCVCVWCVLLQCKSPDVVTLPSFSKVALDEEEVKAVKKVRLDCVPEQPPRRSKCIQEQAASTKPTRILRTGGPVNYMPFGLLP